MFAFGGLLKEVCNEGNSRVFDVALNREEAREYKERKKAQTLGSEGIVLHDVRLYAA